MTEYRYDLLDRLTEVWDNGKRTAEYTYYPDDSIKSLKNGESLYTEYAYDKDKNLTFLKTVLGTEVVAENRYRYDGNGNRTQKEQTQGAVRGLTAYHYDSLNLLRDDRASYTYDAFNRQEKAETFDGNIQINYYDAEGLRHEMEENGRLVQFIFRDKEAVMGGE